MQIHLLNILEKFIKTEKANAEGGLRSLLQSLRDDEGTSRLSILTSYLLTETHLKAHHAVINVPVYLSIIAHICMTLRGRRQRHH